MKRTLDSDNGSLPPAKRHQPDGKEEKKENKALANAQMQLYDCPICFTCMITGKIYQCSNGHVFCETCSTKLEACGECRTSVKNPIRCLVLEKLRDDLPKSCRNKPCEFVANDGKEATLIDHERNKCEHRPIWCWCEQQQTVATLLNHMRTSCKRCNRWPNDGPIEKVCSAPPEGDFSETRAFISTKKSLLVQVRHQLMKANKNLNLDHFNPNAFRISMTVWRIPDGGKGEGQRAGTALDTALGTALLEILDAKNATIQRLDWTSQPLEYPTGPFTDLVGTKNGLVLIVDNVTPYAIDGNVPGCRIRVNFS
jgi:hypothetical protein